ncbi:MAG: peptidylprolyl isomerase [Bernardetiaceae bacterium]
MYYKIKLAILFVLWGGNVLAQPQVIDEIIAKVDDHIILKSDLELTYLNYASSGQPLPPDARCGILQQLLLEKVLLAQAAIDSVIADPVRVEGELERRMAYFYDQYGGREKMEEILGKSVEDLKDELRDQVAEQLTVQKMRGQITDGITVTPSQVKRFFQRIPKDSLPLFPATYELAQIVRYPKISTIEKTKIYDQLTQIRQDILDGKATFEDMAKKYSQDVGSAAQGGCYGFVERGQFVPEYEATAFKLKPEEISMPVESEFGFHIIKLLERRGNRYKSCHILIKPKPNEEDFTNTERFLDSLRNLVSAETVSFSKLAQDFSEDRATRSNGGFLTNPQTGSTAVTVDDFSSESDYAIYMTITEESLKPGEISRPVRFRTPDERDAIRIIFFKKKVNPHMASYTEDYESLHKAALQESKNIAIAKWFEKTVRQLYIYLDDDYQSCGLLEGL